MAVDRSELSRTDEEDMSVSATDTVETRAVSGDLHGDRKYLNDMLRALVNSKGSDLHLTVGAPPTIRVHGSLEALPGYQPLSQSDTTMVIRAAVNDEQWVRFEQEHELDFAYSI